MDAQAGEPTPAAPQAPGATTAPSAAAAPPVDNQRPLLTKSPGGKTLAMALAVAAALAAIAVAFFSGTLPGAKAPSVAAFSSGLSLNVNSSDIVVDIDGLQDQIDLLAKLSDDPAPAVTRVLFTPNDMAARRFVTAQMIEAGLAVREDAIGNIFGRWHGSQPKLGPVLTGSHTDAIPHAGKYDGVLGVLGGIEALAALNRSGFEPKRSLEVVMFTSEEPTRFGTGCLGSRMMADQEGFPGFLRAAVDENGVSFADAAAGAGHPNALQKLRSVVVGPKDYSAFVELHIEQGPVLEREGIPIGVVTAIAAPAAMAIDLKGKGGHAGGLLMADRNDAGLAAAEVALAVEQHVLATNSADTVGTTGKVVLHPNAVNSVPREAHLEIDVRDIDGPRRDAVVAAIKQSTAEIAARRGVTVEKLDMIHADPPAACSEAVMNAVLAACGELQLACKQMVSRAYHDSLFMSRLAPTGMIFIPCANGYSHRPDEFASKEDMARGVQVLALTMAKLSLI